MDKDVINLVGGASRHLSVNLMMLGGKRGGGGIEMEKSFNCLIIIIPLYKVVSFFLYGA